MTLFAKNKKKTFAVISRQSFTINRTLTCQCIRRHFNSLHKKNFTYIKNNVDYHYIVVSTWYIQRNPKITQSKRSFLFYSRMHSMPRGICCCHFYFILFSSTHIFLLKVITITVIFLREILLGHRVASNEKITYVRKKFPKRVEACKLPRDRLLTNIFIANVLHWNWLVITKWQLIFDKNYY